MHRVRLRLWPQGPIRLGAATRGTADSVRPGVHDPDGAIDPVLLLTETIEARGLVRDELWQQRLTEQGPGHLNPGRVQFLPPPPHVPLWYTPPS